MFSATVLGATALLGSFASAHFTLTTPATIGFNDNNEANGPCGGFTPSSSDNMTDFHVGGDAIATSLFHPQANFLYRATLDTTASSGWVELFPIVQQSGLGAFCEPSVSVNSSWAGKSGILSIVCDAPDGMLFQCAHVKFVSGAAASTNSACTNGSSVSASFTSDSALAAYANGTGSGSNTSTASGSSPTSTATKAASAGSRAAIVSSTSLAPVFGVAVMMALGAALL